MLHEIYLSSGNPTCPNPKIGEFECVNTPCVGDFISFRFNNLGMFSHSTVKVGRVLRVY